ncbi:unnamed protein product, partial [Effrenium voratum]
FCLRDTSQSNCLAPPEPMFRGGRLGGIQGAVIPQRFPTFEASESSASGFRNKRSKSSSVLNAVANSPKWIKLDGIHQRYVKRPEANKRAWILSARGSLLIGLAIGLQSLLMGLERTLRGPGVTVRSTWLPQIVVASR